MSLSREIECLLDWSRPWEVGGLQLVQNIALCFLHGAGSCYFLTSHDVLLQEANYREQFHPEPKPHNMVAIPHLGLDSR